ncbi:MAG: DJ-1/PfpI family protein [Saprospiraceae bacterium]|nr:DJ-1/PfpI family protein [Saprospiraceae bacterium]
MQYWPFVLLSGIWITCQSGNPSYTSSDTDTHTISIEQRELNPDWYNVAFLIMDGVYNTELTAPFDIFQHTQYRQGIKAMNVFLVANTREPVITFEGIRILPDYNYLTDSLPKIDILVVPSAEHHLDTDLEDEEMIEWVRRVDREAMYVTSHCDGAFVLAKAGLLDGRASTTFPSDVDGYEKMFPNLDVRRDVLFVHDGKYITSAGGARSFEASLYLAEILYNKEIAESLAAGLVIDWNIETIAHIVE